MLHVLETISIFVGLLVNVLMQSSPQDSVTNTSKWFKSLFGRNPPTIFNEANTDKIVRVGGVILIILGGSPWIWQKVISYRRSPIQDMAMPSPIDSPSVKPPVMSSPEQRKTSTTEAINPRRLTAKEKKTILDCIHSYKLGFNVDHINGVDTRFIADVSDFVTENGGKVFQGNRVSDRAFHGVMCDYSNAGPSLIIGLPKDDEAGKLDVSLFINDQLLDDDITEVATIAVNISTDTGLKIGLKNDSDKTLKNALFELEINDCQISGPAWYLEPADNGHVALFKMRDNIPSGLFPVLPEFRLTCRGQEAKTGAVTLLADDVKSMRYRFLLSQTTK